LCFIVFPAGVDIGVGVEANKGPATIDKKRTVASDAIIFFMTFSFFEFLG
jgi:hypothetical protein